MNQESIDLAGAKILIVDDVSANLNILYEGLAPEGYDILAAPSGEVALKIAARAAPDLILLDVRMPGIDGFETCRRLKADVATAHIPVLFVTAKSETEGIVEGLGLGGVDYIIKPFQYEEVSARVRTHLTIKRLQDGLKAANLELEHAYNQIQTKSDELEQSYRELEAKNKAASQELQDAREMQMSLMPGRAPHIEGFEIAGICLPATVVGGDFFTYLWLDAAKTEFGIVLMDVVGHSMKAAAMAFLAHGMLQSETRSGGRPGDIMGRMHQSLREVLHQRAFVAMSFVQINVVEKSLTYFNAGIPQPVLLRSGTSKKLSIEGNLPLGVRLPAEYVGHGVPVCAGDVLLFFTDGLPEAEDTKGRMYTNSRMGEMLDTLAGEQLSVQALLDAIVNDVRTYTASGESKDDLTVVVLRVL